VHRDKEQLAHYLVNAIGAQRNARDFLQAIVRVQLSQQSELQMYELSRRMNEYQQSEQGMGQGQREIALREETGTGADAFLPLASKRRGDCSAPENSYVVVAVAMQSAL